MIHLVNNLFVSLKLVNLRVLLCINNQFKEDCFVLIVNIFWDHVILSLWAMSSEKLLNISPQSGWDPKIVLISVDFLEVLFDCLSEFPQNEFDKSLSFESTFTILLLFFLNLGLLWFLNRDYRERSSKGRSGNRLNADFSTQWLEPVRVNFFTEFTLVLHCWNICCLCWLTNHVVEFLSWRWNLRKSFHLLRFDELLFIANNFW